MLENSDVKVNDDELKQIDILNKKQVEIENRKIVNEIKKHVSEESLITDNRNEFINCDESYDNFETRNNKSQLNELKIVIAKSDNNIKRSKISDSDISSNDNIQSNVKQINVEIAEEMKPKKPFSGPLSEKIARQKLEIVLKINFQP